MDWNSLATKTGITIGVNGVVGGKVVGIGAATFSTPVGCIVDTTKLKGYTFNPSDGKWYSIPPAPAYGQFAWEGAADIGTQQRLNELKCWHEQGNQIESRRPDTSLADDFRALVRYKNVGPPLGGTLELEGSGTWPRDVRYPGLSSATDQEINTEIARLRGEASNRHDPLSGWDAETYERLQREWADRTARGGSNTATNGIGNHQIPDDLNPWNHNLLDPATSNGTVNSGWNLGEQNRRLAEALGLTEPRRGGDGAGTASPSGSSSESPSGSIGYLAPWQGLPPAPAPASASSASSVSAASPNSSGSNTTADDPTRSSSAGVYSYAGGTNPNERTASGYSGNYASRVNGGAGNGGQAITDAEVIQIVYFNYFRGSFVESAWQGSERSFGGAGVSAAASSGAFGDAPGQAGSGSEIIPQASLPPPRLGIESTSAQYRYIPSNQSEARWLMGRAANVNYAITTNSTAGTSAFYAQMGLMLQDAAQGGLMIAKQAHTTCRRSALGGRFKADTVKTLVRRASSRCMV